MITTVRRNEPEASPPSGSLSSPHQARPLRSPTVVRSATWRSPGAWPPNPSLRGREVDWAAAKRVAREMQRNPRARHIAMAVLITVATGYWYFTAASAAVARVVPAAVGWPTAVVVGGSMEPYLSAGDVVAFAPLDGTLPPPGTIVAFEDPAHPGVTLTHRVVAVNPDGSLQTKGDANAAPDSTPVQPGAVIGAARLVSPGAGLPFYWWRTGRTAALAVWIVVSLLALVLATRRLPTEPRRVKRRLRPAPVILALALLGGVVVAGWTTAAYSATTANTGDSFGANWAAHQGMIASGSCGGTSTVMSVTATAATAGRTVIIRVAVRDTPAAATFSASDSRGNTYTVDVVASDGVRTRVAIISSNITTSLLIGDSIVVTHPSNQASTARADVYSGIASSGRVVTTGTAAGNSAGASVTVNTAVPDTAVVGIVATRNASTITQPAPWLALENGNVSCASNMGRAAAWRSVHTASAVTYNPSFATSERWSAAVVVYRTISS